MKLIKKLIITLITIACAGTTFAQDYSYFKPNDDLIIRDVEIQNGEIYLLGTQSIGNYSIQVFDTDKNKFETLFTSADFNKHRLTNIKDMVFFENDIYVINDNKLINISDGFIEYSLTDEYDFKPKSDKYRQLHNVTVRDNSLIIGSTSAEVLSRDTLAGTPVAYIEPFNELLKYESGEIKRVLDERETNYKFDFYFSPILDKQNNLWFRERQNMPLKGGVIKISEEYEVKIFDLKSYSGVSYILQPSSIDIIDNTLYIGMLPRKESNYLEGLSIYNVNNKEWNYTIDYLTNNDIYEGYNWDTPTKIMKLSNGNLAILGSQFSIQHDSGYLYFDLTKSQKEKYGIQDWYDNLDLFETESKYIIIRQSGILVFDKSTITSVKEELVEKYNYQISNNLIEFTDKNTGNYRVYDLVGKVITDDAYEGTINLSNLLTGPYFIKLNNEYIIKFIKE